jgi:hypothetical protein
VPGARARDSAYVTPQESPEPSSTAAGAPLFAVDQTGTIAYIRRTNMHVERRLELAARRGRNPEGMMHFGAALHAIEDLFAHSNWVEIAVNKVLSGDASLLDSLKGDDRHVFTYSAQQEVADGKKRDVLLTGSFTGDDTKISVSSEAVSFMSSPLSPPATPAEELAEERFMTSILRAYEAQLASNPAFKRQVRELMVSKGVPGIVADEVMNLPVSQMYDITRLHFLPDVVKENVINPVKAAVREGVSTFVMKPAARAIQAEGINATVADTSLLTFLRKQQAASAKSFESLSAEEVRALEASGKLTGKDPRTVHAEDQAAAGRHVQALQGSPERVVAGPSHSQISKDHPNSPFFGLAFRMAAAAVRRMRQRMIDAWKEQAQGAESTPFDFTAASFPSGADVPKDQTEAAESNRRLYQDTRATRAKREQESLGRGNQIIGHGGDERHGPKFIPYDVDAMRADQSNQIRAAAAGLRGLVGAPDELANALSRVEGALGRLEAVSEHTKRAREILHIGAAIGHAASAGADAQALLRLADQVAGVADAVGSARTHALRWGANTALREVRTRVVDALLTLELSTKPRATLAAGTVAIIEEQIADTTPSYTIKQRDVLEGATDFGPHTGPRGPLQTTTINLADPGLTIDAAWQGGVRGPALKALISESRVLLNHPLENLWWEGLVRDYISRFPEQTLADIQGRNAGYATLRHPGEAHGDSH